MWLKKKSPQTTTRIKVVIPFAPSEYPTGTAVLTEKGWYLINKDGKRYRIPNNSVLDSWSFPIMVDSTEAVLSRYPVALTRLGYRDSTLLNNTTDGKLYLVSAGKLRLVTSQSVLDRLGLHPTRAIPVTSADIKLMKLGEDIY